MQLITIKMVDGTIIEALIDSVDILGRQRDNNRLVFAGWDQTSEMASETKTTFNINLDHCLFHKVRSLLTGYEQMQKDLEKYEKND